MSPICTFVLLAWAFMVGGSGHVAPRDVRPRQQPPSARAGSSRFALLLVNDARENAIVDIGVDDFVVQEGGVDRDVLDVRVADYPVVIVVDNAASAEAELPAMKAALGRFLERLGPRPVAVITTASPPRVVAAFEDERESVVETLGTIEAAAGARSEPLGAAALGARTIMQTGAFFSTIVMAVASPVEGNGAGTETLIAPIVDSRTVLHVVAEDPALSGTGTPMRSLVQQTRGIYTPIFAAASYMPAMERLASRLTTELLLEYIVPGGSRAIDPKVGVRIPGAHVRGLGVAPR